MLKQNKFAQCVLNAKQHAREAQVVAETRSGRQCNHCRTNMAGRDIKLGPGVKGKQKLWPYSSWYRGHESRRVDLAVRGQAGLAPRGDLDHLCSSSHSRDDLMRMLATNV